MERIRRILVCLNEPEQTDPALWHAIQLAKVNRARLTLTSPDASGANFWQGDRIRFQLRTARQDWLDDLAANVAQQVPDVQAKVIDGRPALSIAQPSGIDFPSL